eukprot:533996-Hanusia_phi.AAC.1
MRRKLDNEVEFNQRLLQAIQNAMPEIDAMQRRTSERTSNVAAMGLMSVSHGVGSRQEVDAMDSCDAMHTNFIPAEIGSSPIHAMPRGGRGGNLLFEGMQTGPSLPHLRGGGNVLALGEEKPYTSQERKLNKRLCKVWEMRMLLSIVSLACVQAVGNGNETAIRKLIKDGADPNYK